MNCTGTGQDQMRIVKLRLVEMVPNAHIFLGARNVCARQHAPRPRMSLSCERSCCLRLVCGFADVDDLKEGKGAEYVDASMCCLVFCSSGYFQSAK